MIRLYHLWDQGPTYAFGINLIRNLSTQMGSTMTKHTSLPPCHSEQSNLRTPKGLSRVPVLTAVFVLQRYSSYEFWAPSDQERCPCYSGSPCANSVFIHENILGDPGQIVGMGRDKDFTGEITTVARLVNFPPCRFRP